ncbi:hypothetical protein OAK75_06350 [Bacteriovoracales bacterium]|nr:hypothetical protein [Bacteriovoracales bacterium]
MKSKKDKVVESGALEQKRNLPIAIVQNYKKLKCENGAECTLKEAEEEFLVFAELVQKLKDYR